MELCTQPIETRDISTSYSACYKTEAALLNCINVDKKLFVTGEHFVFFVGLSYYLILDLKCSRVQKFMRRTESIFTVFTPDKPTLGRFDQ